MKTNNAVWLTLLCWGSQHHLAAMQDARTLETLTESFDREDEVPEPTESLFRALECEAAHPGTIENIAQSITDLVKTYSAECDAEDTAGNRPLHIAAAAGLDDAVNALLDLGADVDAKMNGGQGATALRLAVERGHATTAALLAKRGARVTKRIMRVARRA